MSIFIASLILITIGSMYAILLKRKLAETFFLAIVTVVGALYCFGLVNVSGCLLWGIYFLTALSASCVIFLVCNFIKNRKILNEIEILQGCLMYSAVIAFSMYVNFERTVQGWDEFSHWGFIVKHFYVTDALGTFKHPNYDVMFTSYFPGTSLFQYFFTRFSSQFTEYYSYIAMNIMHFSLIMPFIKDIFSKNLIKRFLLLVAFIVLPLAQPVDFHIALYVDAILGTFFGFSILYYFIYKYEEAPYGILMTSAAIFMLTVTKDIGLLFSLIVVGIIFLDIALFRRSEIKEYMALKAGWIYKLKSFALLISPLITTLFVKFSWVNLLERSHARIVFKFPALNDIYMLLAKKQAAAPYQIEVVKIFINDGIWRKITYLNINIVRFSAIFVAVVLLLSWISQKKLEFRRIVTAALLLIMGLIANQFVLMVMYAFAFGEYEGIQLAAYERYTSTYLIGMLFFLMLFYLPKQSKFGKINLFKIKEKTEMYKFGKICLYLLITVCLVKRLIVPHYQRITYVLKSRKHNPDSFKLRPTAIAIEKWKSYFEKTNPYLIAQEEKGLSYLIMRYELIPYSKLSNRGHDYSISPNNYYYGIKETDPWTLIISPEDWEKYVLSNHKLVYVYKSNKQLQTVYGRFFLGEVKDDMLFQVQNNNGKLLLIPLAAK